nr:hypothetical protein [Tanacetum cinerariifolium]
FQLRDNSELHRILAALWPLRLLLDVNAHPIPGLYLAGRVGRSILGDAGQQVVLNDGAVVEIQHGRLLCKPFGQGPCGATTTDGYRAP